jgi:predicted alpha/beta hydrolase
MSSSGLEERPQVREERVALRAGPDRRTLAAHVWLGDRAQERSVVFAGGIGAPQRYLRALAGGLARRGWGVMTFDYRGVGESHETADYLSILADDWAHGDLPAAVEGLRALSGARRLVVFAHSVGGQLFGMSPATAQVDGALLVGAQRGIPRLFRGAARARVEYAYRVFPLLARVFGRIPHGRFTFPEPCPPRAVVQWIAWGRMGVFTDAQGIDVEERFARFEGPLVCAHVEDDLGFAPPAAVDALAALYTRARLTRVAIAPRDYGVDRLGHFGLFSPRAPRRLWDRIDGWLRTVADP